MGLLDDAIREHLELKRRAGFDPDEMSRLERSAFGATAPADEPVAPTIGRLWEAVFDAHVEGSLVQPTFVTHYPIEFMAALLTSVTGSTDDVVKTSTSAARWAFPSSRQTST